MTARLYSTEPVGHGGKRVHQAAPLLTWQQVAEARQLRALGVPYKVLVRKFKCSRETLSWAVNGRRTYRGWRDPNHSDMTSGPAAHPVPARYSPEIYHT
jgi:hypothetical protein